MFTPYRVIVFSLIFLSALIGGNYILSFYVDNTGVGLIAPLNVEKLKDRSISRETSQKFDDNAQRTVLGNPLKFNANFDQSAVCRLSGSCDIPIFSLRSERELDFPVTVLDVVEINSGAKINIQDKNGASDLDRQAEAKITLLGEKAYFAKNEDFGVFKTYLDDVNYANIRLIAEQPRSYIFSLKKELAGNKKTASERSGVLKSGYYEKWTFSRTPMRLEAGGKYIFNQLESKVESEILITNSEDKNVKPTYIFIEEKIGFMPKISFEKKSSDVIFVVAGTNTIEVKNNFYGLLVCPYCAIEIDNKSADFHGQIYARSIRLHPDSTITHRQYNMISMLAEIGNLTLQSDSADTDYIPLVATDGARLEQRKIFDTGNEKIDSMVTAFIKVGGGYGEEQKKQYEKILLDLQSNAAESAAAISDYYQRLTPNLDNQQYRWKLVQMLGSINTAHAVSALESVALSSHDAQQFGYMGEDAKRFNKDEQMIRIRSIDGLALRAEKGDVNAVDALYRIATTRSGAEQSLAIQNYIFSGNSDERIENIRRALPNVALQFLNKGQ